MKSLDKYISEAAVKGKNYKLYPVADTANQVNVVQIGEPFELNNKAYFGNVKNAIDNMIGEVKSPYDKYESARKALEEGILGEEEIVWVYDASEGDYGSYIIPKKYIKNIK